MADTIPDLWPKSIQKSILSPIAILRIQGEALSRRTGGLVMADIVATQDRGRSHVTFDLVAPGLKSSSLRILEIKYSDKSVYPVEVFPPPYEGEDPAESDRFEADTAEQFMEILKRVFERRDIVSSIQAMIASSNDLQLSTNGVQAETQPVDG